MAITYDLVIRYFSIERYRNSSIDFFSLLSPSERSTLASVVSETRREEFLTSHAILRLFLAKISGISPHELEITHELERKPTLSLTNGTSLSFSMSHSGPFVFIAVVRSGLVGVDVELIDKHRNHLSIAKYAFHQSEYEQLIAAPESMHPEVFTACWCRKEAVVKCVGGSVAVMMDRFEASLSPERGKWEVWPGDAASAAAGNEPSFPYPVFIYDLPAGPIAKAAVASTKRPARIDFSKLRKRDLPVGFVP